MLWFPKLFSRKEKHHVHDVRNAHPEVRYDLVASNSAIASHNTCKQFRATLGRFDKVTGKNKKIKVPMFIMFPKAWCLVEKINLVGHANPTLQGGVESVNVNTLSRDTASKHLRNTLWTILRDALGKLPVKTCLTDTLGKDAVKTIWSQGTFDGQNACGNTLLDTVGKSGGTLLATRFGNCTWEMHIPQRLLMIVWRLYKMRWIVSKKATWQTHILFSR